MDEDPSPVLDSPVALASSPNDDFQTNNTCPDYQRSTLPARVKDWTIDQVIGHFTHLDPTLGHEVQKFRFHEIDGEALLLLTREPMMNIMGVKLGPTLKILNIIAMLKGQHYQPLPRLGQPS